MKKNGIMLLIVLMALLLLCACGITADNIIYKGEKYSVYEQNGSYYLDIFGYSDMLKEIENSEMAALVKAPWVDFSSVAEMKQAIESGNIPESTLLGFITVQQDGTPIEICDLNNLYDITMPTDVSFEEVTWYGSHYVFDFLRNEMYGYLQVIDQQNYEREYANLDINNWSAPQTIISEETVKDRNATVVRYRNDTGEYKIINYQIETESGMMYVSEHYSLGFSFHLSGDPEPSETIPDTIDFCGTSGDAYFHGWMSDFSERPSVQWLSEFGVVEYETTDGVQ